MADYKRLDKRYTLLRSLEKEERGGVHFVNYFTICEGRPKKIKPRKAGTGDELEVDQDGDLRSDALGNPLDQETLSEEADEPSGEGMQSLTLTSTDPIPASDTESEGNYTPSISGSYKDAQDYLNAKEPEEDEPGSDPEGDTGGMHHLPPVPAEPVAPPAFDASKYSEKDALKLAEKHYSRQLKAYQQAFKGREKVIKERENLIRKREEKRRRDEQRALQRAEKGAIKLAKAQLREDAKKEQRRRAEEKATEKASQKKFKQLEKEASKEKQESEKAEKIRLKEEKKRAKEASTANVDVGQEDDNGGERGDLKILKKRKLKTFCMTPPKAASARRKDWIPVFVADVDQVGAHCGLFQVDKPHYEPFVGRVVEKIESWVDSISETTLA